MKPLIKWPGGKSREFVNIKDIIPTDIDKYIEPFFGGGGIYFSLEPKSAIINDINDNLMYLYKFIKDENRDFKKFIVHIANDWDTLSTIAEKVYEDTHKYKNNISAEAITEEIYKLSRNNSLPRLINGQEKYWQLLSKGLIDKLRRIVGLEIKSGIFSDKDFHEQVVAVTKGAYYYYVRDIFRPKTKEEEVSQFLFLREFSYGSMFRFNKDGKFNIPYGGASYNDKSLYAKINYAFSPGVLRLLKATSVYRRDFREFFEKIGDKITRKDFCFFDPPYDTEFSEYDRHSFGRADQADLARIFGKLKCRAIMIIKKTDFIDDVYREQASKNPCIKIEEYEKNYSYNVRGRNERGVTHLLIRNY